MNVSDILRNKGSGVTTIEPDRTVAMAIRLLVKHRIGAVVVVEHDTICGILSERDVLRLTDRDPSLLHTLTVAEAMTRDLVIGEPGDDIGYVMEILTKNRVRHLPIVEEGRLAGILSIGDVVHALRSGLEAENRYLRDYVQGTIS
ncbi:MAG: CBS domain-containing protein [Gemmatimonadetes bacterium]|nr:CBS domain-containing protein [Gemmatimonadota bacterium]